MVVVEYFLSWLLGYVDRGDRIEKPRKGKGDPTSTEIKIFNPSCFFHIFKSLSNSSAL